MGKAQSKSGILTEKLKVKLKKENFKEDHQEDCTDVSQEDDGTDDRCNKTEGASLFYGTHEIQELSECGEVDPHTHLASCKKNPGHTEFVPVNDFYINHLPKGHQDSDLVQVIMATADLTVRVAVKKVSTERPEFWPNTNQPYPFYDKRGSDVTMLGTGMVTYVNKWTDEVIMIKEYNTGNYRYPKVQRSDTHRKVWGKVRMNTATHVVFDDLEARHTTCRLFFDRQDSPLVTLDGWTVYEAKIEEDRCMFKCVTCDVDLLDKLYKMWRHSWGLWRNVCSKYKSSRDEVKLTLIVSHPHGCPKQISVGQWINRYVVDVDEDDKCGTMYSYTTCTCPGSSGARVHLLGYYDSWSYDHHVHSGVNSAGNNFCGVGREGF